MPLYVVGLGLYDEKDITVRGLEAVKKCSIVYLESYTSILLVPKSRLEAFYGKEILDAHRTDVESLADATIIEKAKTQDVAFLVVGDPFCATTHADLVLRARQAGIKVIAIHNASIMNGVAACGLQLYRFGQTISIPYFDQTWRPSSWYDKIAANRKQNLHTLCLLDIRVKEQTPENLMKGNSIYEPPRFMTIKEAISQLFEIESERKEGVCGPEVMGFGIARLGSQEDQLIQGGTLRSLYDVVEWGNPLHSLVICAPELHDIELEFCQHTAA